MSTPTTLDTAAATGPLDPVGADLNKILRTLKLGGLNATLPERLALARQRKMGHAAFLEHRMNAATISSSTFVLRDPGNALVASTVSYNGSTSVATLTPTPTRPKPMPPARAVSIRFAEAVTCTLRAWGMLAPLLMEAACFVRSRSTTTCPSAPTAPPAPA